MTKSAATPRSPVNERISPDLDIAFFGQHLSIGTRHFRSVLASLVAEVLIACLVARSNQETVAFLTGRPAWAAQAISPTSGKGAPCWTSQQVRFPAGQFE